MAAQEIHANPQAYKAFTKTLWMFVTKQNRNNKLFSAQACLSNKLFRPVASVSI